MQPRDQRHIDPYFLGLGLEHLEGIDALGDFAQAGHRLIQAQALTEGKTDLIVAALG
ncbi:hypothetical protein D3C72_2546010 [compost metagenome]